MDEIDEAPMEMRKNRDPFKVMKAPYKLALEDNDWEGLIRHFEQQSLSELFDNMTLDGDNVFHIVALICPGKDVLERLIDLLPTAAGKREAVESCNCYGNTVLHEVAAAGNLEAAEFLLDSKSSHEYAGRGLLEILNLHGETPLYRAAALGQTLLVMFFAARVDNKKMEDNFIRSVDGMSILHNAVTRQHFETALWLQTNYESLAERKDAEEFTSLQLLAQMPLAFKPVFHKSFWKMLVYYCLPVEDNLVSPNKNKDLKSSSGKQRQSSYRKKLADGVLMVLFSIWNFLAQGWPTIYTIWQEKRDKKSLEKLTHLLVNKDLSWSEVNELEMSTKFRNPEVDVKLKHKASKAFELDGPQVYIYSNPLLMATSTGAVSIVEEILNVHPHAIEYVSENDKDNILHVAIRHRQYYIFKLIKSRKTIMSRLAPRIDAYGNTILHQASDSRYYSTVDKPLSGPAMQLQDELRWVQRVQKIVPRNYTMHRNNKSQTAVELFNEQHKDLLKSAQDWMKDTAQACTVVAVLVATLVFAAAYTVPGGNDPNSGFPIFLDSPLFWVFTIMDITSLASSLAAVVMFLTILTSPLEYPYFCRSLPRKLKIGFALLFFSMITTMLAFSATIFLLINNLQKKWTRSLVYTVALLPVTVFGLVQFPLYQALSEWAEHIYKKIIKILPRRARNRDRYY